MQRQNYRLFFNFSYGFLDDQSIWIRPPSNHLFRIDRLTLQVILDLNTGLSQEAVCKKYNLAADDVQSLIQRFEKEGAIVDSKWAKITFEKQREDISLVGYILLFGFLGLIQIDYFQNYAQTYLLNSWWEAVAVALIAIVAILFHELGHYLIARRYFKPKFGFTFLFIFPAVYVDTQQAWRLPGNMRLLINGAGLLADFLVNTLAIILALNFHLEYYVTPFLLTQYTRLSFILNPLFPTDGYWILSDLTKTVNLGKVGWENLKKLRLNLYSLYGFLSLTLMMISTLGVIWFLFNLLQNFLLRFLF